MRHKWINTFFRGVESSATQTCKGCGLIKDNCFIPARYIKDGVVQFSAGECTTKAIEQMVEESLIASKADTKYY